jgi:hypothetical protein
MASTLAFAMAWGIIATKALGNIATMEEDNILLEEPCLVADINPEVDMRLVVGMPLEEVDISQLEDSSQEVVVSNQVAMSSLGSFLILFIFDFDYYLLAFVLLI